MRRASEHQRLEREQPRRPPPSPPRAGGRAAPPSKRIVSCGSQSSRGAGAERQPRLDPRRAAGRAVDPLRRLGRRHQRRPGAGLEPPVDAVAAGHAAGGVDQHHLGRRPAGRGSRALAQPCWNSRSSRTRAVAPATPPPRRGRGRAAARIGARDVGGMRGAQSSAARTAALAATAAAAAGFYRLIKNRAYASVGATEDGRGPWHPPADARHRRRTAGAGDARGELLRHRPAADRARGAGRRRPLLLLLRRALHHRLPDLDRHPAVHPRDRRRRHRGGGAHHPLARTSSAACAPGSARPRRSARRPASARPPRAARSRSAGCSASPPTR